MGSNFPDTSRIDGAIGVGAGDYSNSNIKGLAFLESEVIHHMKKAHQNC